MTPGRLSAIGLASIPFAFALIRAIRSGDLRYVGVALAGFASAALTVWISRPAKSILALAAAVFVVATLASVAAALPMGTRFGAGLLIVGSAFGLCFAAGAWFHLRDG